MSSLDFQSLDGIMRRQKGSKLDPELAEKTGRTPWSIPDQQAQNQID